jgi:hypothetical protein
MPAILYGTFPLLLPGKTESISKNGLKKISGTIAFLEGQIQAARAIADGFGSVFPEPTIRHSENKILEMSFDAYSNTNKSSSVISANIITLSKSFTDSVITTVSGVTDKVDYNWTINETWLTDSITFFSVGLSNSSVNNGVISGGNLSSIRVSKIIQGKKKPGGTSNLTINWVNQVTSIARRNFGAFDEVDTTTSLIGDIQ